MASLLKWAKDRANNVASVASRSYDQVNPLDNGRTFKQRTPTNNNSAPQQATHNGLTNLIGDILKPVVHTGMAVNQGIGNAELKIASRPTLPADQFFGKGATNFTGYTGTKRQIAGDALNTALTVAAPGAGKVIDKSFAAVAPKVIPKLAVKAVANAGTGAVVGAPFGASSFIASDQPFTRQGLQKAALQGAQAGAVLGAGAAIAPPVLKAGGRQVVKGAKQAPQIAVKLDQKLTETPQTSALRQTNKTLQQQFDKVTSPTQRRLINQQMAKNNAEIRATTQGGFAKIPVSVGNTLKQREYADPKTWSQQATDIQQANRPLQELPTYNTKLVSNADKAVRSTQSIIARQGEHGQQLAGMLQHSRDSKEMYLAQIQKQLPTVTAIARKDKNRLRGGGNYENFVEATQGRAEPKNAKVAQAVAEWQAVHPTVRQRAVNAGLEVGDLGKTYYPHFIDFNQVFKNKNTYNQSINHLVATGQAKSAEDAVNLLSKARDVSRNREFGNLEASRLIDLPFYDKTPNSLISYLNGSAKRISHVETFGKGDEHALKLITQAGMKGYDTEAMKHAFDIAVGAKRYSPTAEAVSGNIRKYVTTTRLGLGALTNVSQNVNTGIVTGHLRTLSSAIKQLSPKTRSFVGDTGVIADAVLSDLKTQAGYSSFSQKVLGKTINKITAPGFGAVEKLNRSIAATAGRDYALRLAQKGNTQTLRKLGVTGDIKGGTLTEAQQIQAARKVVEKTQFKVDPQDLPGWADTPGGKLVAQFRTFSYMQGKFVSNEILKPAAHGNVLPLGRLLAALPVGLGLYETKRVIAGRPEEENPTKIGLATAQNVGGFGLVFDLYQSLNPLGSKYIPTDRRVSMATGAIGGPAVGVGTQLVGAVSEAAQRKNIPKTNPDLTGKVAIRGKDDYTDLTPISRFGIQQLPVVGTGIKNRLLPFQKESKADTGTPDSPAVQLKADKKQESDKVKTALSPDDYQLYKLSKTDRQKLIDSGKVDKSKFDGLDGFVNTLLGVKSVSAASPTTPGQLPQGISAVKIRGGETRYDTLHDDKMVHYKTLDEAKAAQAKNMLKYSPKDQETINGQVYHKTEAGLIKKGPAAPKPVANPVGERYASSNTKTGKWVQHIQTEAPKRGLDMDAVLAVAAAEGLGGGVGDGGTSYGPFQLHIGGALPAGKDQAWAESPEGLNYALDKIASVAKGKKGQDAIDAIVRQFEQPADPDGEVQRALSMYGRVDAYTKLKGSGYGSTTTTAAKKAKTTTGSTRRSGSSKATGPTVTSVNKLISTIKTTNAAIKPPKPPAKPRITVKTAGTPSSFKKTALKQYSPGKAVVSKTKRA